jgi:hypothetical protein
MASNTRVAFPVDKARPCKLLLGSVSSVFGNFMRTLFLLFYKKKYIKKNSRHTTADPTDKPLAKTPSQAR